MTDESPEIRETASEPKRDDASLPPAINEVTADLLRKQLEDERYEHNRLKNRHNALLTILSGFVFLEIGHFLSEYSEDFLLVIFPVVAAVLLVFGIYHYYVPEQD